MGTGASVKKGKFATPAELNEALLAEPQFEKEAAAHGLPVEMVSRLDKRFKIVDKSSTGFITMQDIHALPGYKHFPAAMEKVFQNGFTQDPPAKALDFDAFLSPAHAFTKHGNVHGKLRWVFGVLAEQQKELSFAQFLTMAEALDLTVDTSVGFAAQFEEGRTTITEDEFVEFMLAEMTEQDATVFQIDLSALE